MRDMKQYERHSQSSTYSLLRH